MSALKAIHVAKRELQLDDDTYRALLVRVTGKSSAGEMTLAEQERVILEFRRQGFKKPAKPPSRRLDGPYIKKLQALWIAAWNLGLARDNCDQALIAFMKRQTGIEHPRFLRDANDSQRVIEALKGWMERAGVNWSEGDHIPAWLSSHGPRIATAQWRLIHDDFDLAAFRAFVAEQTGKQLADLDRRDWVGVMNKLGEQVRSRQP